MKDIDGYIDLRFVHRNNRTVAEELTEKAILGFLLRLLIQGQRLFIS